MLAGTLGCRVQVFSPCFRVPEGRLTIARRFNAGKAQRKIEIRPVGTAEIDSRRFQPCLRHGTEVGRPPAAEAAGYYQTSLRDDAVIPSVLLRG